MITPRHSPNASTTPSDCHDFPVLDCYPFADLAAANFEALPRDDAPRHAVQTRVDVQGVLLALDVLLDDRGLDRLSEGRQFVQVVDDVVAQCSAARAWFQVVGEPMFLSVNHVRPGP